MTVAEINALLYSSRSSARSTGARVAHRRALTRMARVVRGVAAQRHRCRWEWQRRTRAGSGGASGCAGISLARGDGDRSRVRRRPVADDAEPRRSAAARGSAGPVRGLASSANAHGPAAPKRRRPPLFRSYSLSGPASTERYRISVKIEPNGAAGTYLREHVRVGDALDVSAPRGSFILQPGERPVVLLSAGIGATPVLAMLHALAATRSTRPVWWLHGARDRQHHPFAAEVRRLHARAPARPQLCVLQPSGCRRPDGGGLRRDRSPVAIGLRSSRRATRRGRLSLRADALHGRDERGARRDRAWRRSGFTSSSSTAASR